MSHYPNQNRDSSCKCKYCLTHDHINSKKNNNQRRSHNHESHVSGGGGGGGGGLPGVGRVPICGHARGMSPPRFSKLDQSNCCTVNKCNLVEEPVECRKTHFQELRKTWSEFARVCNCPNCKGSLQKERYLDKLAESADRASSYKKQQLMSNCEEECCCFSASSIPHNHKNHNPTNRSTDFDYDHQQQMLRQQRDGCHMQHQQPMLPFAYQEVSSDEGFTDCPGNVGCKCLTCTCRNTIKTCRGDGAPVGVGGVVPRYGGVKKEWVKHAYY